MLAGDDAELAPIPYSAAYPARDLSMDFQVPNPAVLCVNIGPTLIHTTSFSLPLIGPLLMH